jgi:hypothetical protein
MFSASAAFAQSPQSSIRESTDPARVAEVERRAQDLRSGQSTSGAGAQAQMQQPAATEHGRMHGDGKRGHGRGHGHHRMHHGHPKAAPNTGK